MGGSFRGHTRFGITVKQKTASKRLSTPLFQFVWNQNTVIRFRLKWGLCHCDHKWRFLPFFEFLGVRRGVCDSPLGLWSKKNTEKWLGCKHHDSVDESRVLKIPKCGGLWAGKDASTAAAGQQRGAIARRGVVFARARQENTVNIKFKFTKLQHVIKSC